MDSFQSISDKLNELSKFDNSARTKISRLKQLLLEIEKAVEAGVTRTKIIQVLNEHGLNLTLQSYGVMMNRLKIQSAEKVTLVKKELSDTPTKELSFENNNSLLGKSFKQHRQRIENEDSDN